jgi:hypothetical protein
MQRKSFLLSVLVVLVFSLTIGYVLPVNARLEEDPIRRPPGPERTCTVQFEATTGGWIDGVTSQLLLLGWEGTEVTAKANAGYIFDGWSDGGNTATRVGVCLVTGETRVFTANFRRLGIPTLFIPTGMGPGANNRVVMMNERGFVGVADQGGVNVFMYLNSQAEFEVAGSQSNKPERHEIKILNLDMNTKAIKVQFASEPQVFDMSLGDSLKIDLDGDKIADISVKYQDLVINRVEMTLSSADSTLIAEEVPCQTCGVVEVPVVAKYMFDRDLYLNMIGEDVKELQKFLNNHGFLVATEGPGSLGNETEKFGSLTKQALIKFQLANSISPAIGYFGEITRGIVNGLME